VGLLDRLVHSPWLFVVAGIGLIALGTAVNWAFGRWQMHALEAEWSAQREEQLRIVLATVLWDWKWSADQGDGIDLDHWNDFAGACSFIGIRVQADTAHLEATGEFRYLVSPTLTEWLREHGIRREY
jgi:hypothetical protein